MKKNKFLIVIIIGLLLAAGMVLSSCGRDCMGGCGRAANFSECENDCPDSSSKACTCK